LRKQEETGVGPATRALDADQRLSCAAAEACALALPARNEATYPARVAAPAAQHGALSRADRRARGADGGDHDHRLAWQPAAPAGPNAPARARLCTQGLVPESAEGIPLNRSHCRRPNRR